MNNRDKQKTLIPNVHSSVFVAEGARIYGDVEIEENASVWFNAVIRGDEGRIYIGRNTNIQDNAVVHSDMAVEAIIGDNVTIGHGAIIRGCRIGNNVMIGMNSTVMTWSEIGDNSIIGAHSFVPYRSMFPPRSLIVGIPAKRIREIREEEISNNVGALAVYRALIEQYSNRTILGYQRK